MDNDAFGAVTVQKQNKVHKGRQDESIYKSKCSSPILPNAPISL